MRSHSGEKLVSSYGDGCAAKGSLLRTFVSSSGSTGKPITLAIRIERLLPTPRFYLNSVRPLNMFLWMPLLERLTVACRGRNLIHDASWRRHQPRVVAGSVRAGVYRCLGLARRLVADRIPGVPPRSAAHPGLCTDGLPGRRRAVTKCARSRRCVCSRPRVEDERTVERRSHVLRSSPALLSPLSSLLSRAARVAF